MPLYRRFRTVIALGALAGALSVGLAAWSGGSPAYVVRPGDTLWSIATSNGITVAQLASANGMNPLDILPIGRQLAIPSASGAVVTDSTPVATGSGNPFSFCATFTPTPGPTGVLPSPLTGSDRYGQLEPIFEHWAAYYGLSRPLLEAVAWEESGWQQGVVSVTGAVGIGQIEPYTAAFISQQLVGIPLDFVGSVSDNIRMSAAFLSYLAGREADNQCATIAAYYEGPVNLQTFGVLPDARTYVADVQALIPRFD
ncbi:MAG: LysM peptidoglycan-binding domain-containing protein [Actinomycetota bacterium]|nr:LysM peptidoglycan-binding domain-containing protein [Actinomycetota bacterium]